MKNEPLSAPWVRRESAGFAGTVVAAIQPGGVDSAHSPEFCGQ